MTKDDNLALLALGGLALLALLSGPNAGLAGATGGGGALADAPTYLTQQTGYGAYNAPAPNTATRAVYGSAPITGLHESRAVSYQTQKLQLPTGTFQRN